MYLYDTSTITESSMVGQRAHMAGVARKPSIWDCGVCASCGGKQKIKMMLSRALLQAKGWFNI
jgi:hypothetical protein